MVKFDQLPTKDAPEDNSMAESAMASDSEDVESTKDKTKVTEESQKKRKRQPKSKKDKVNGSKKRRHSVSKPARDPRDQASPLSSESGVMGTRSPSPVIDFDGLSKPST